MANKFGILGTLAGIAVSIAVPFISPAIAGAIFGSSIMASLGGVGGLLATAGTGALLGAAGAALTGNDWAQGALFGGLGAGAVQGIGGFASSAAPLFGAATTGASAVPSAGLAGIFGGGATAAPAVAGAAQAGLSGAAGSIAGGLGASAAPAAAGLGAFQMPWDKLLNAGIASAPSLLGASISEMLPPSEEALALQQQAQNALNGQETEYKMAIKGYNDIDPHYFAQTASNAARLRTAQMSKEGQRAAYAGLNDPARNQAENRRTAVEASSAAGQAYNDSYLTALEAKRGQASMAAGLRPNYGDYAKYISEYGPDAERRRRSEEFSGWLAPFASAFAKSNTVSQAGTA